MTNSCQHGPFGLCRFCRYEPNALEDAVKAARVERLVTDQLAAEDARATRIGTIGARVFIAIAFLLVALYCYFAALADPLGTFFLLTVIFVAGASGGRKGLE